ncbi:PIN domain-containing protein [Nanoarchaeota archaeon]
MNIVIDVNIILSALLRDSLTREILLTSEFDFYFPEPSLQKIRKYQDYILKKSRVSEKEYRTVLTALLIRIKIVSTEEIIENFGLAKQIMEEIDPEDVTFIATALSMNNSVIWSDDKDFDKQDTVIILKTHQMKELS